MQSKLPMHLSPRLWSAEKEREPVPLARDGERPLPHARRDIAGSAEGK